MQYMMIDQVHNKNSWYKTFRKTRDFERNRLCDMSHWFLYMTVYNDIQSTE